jgi:hypothetical protein
MNFVKSIASVSLIGVLLALGGCASPSTHQAMMPTNLQLAKQHPQTVSVTAGGGAETDKLGKSQISDVELRLAVVESIKASKAFSSVIEGAKGDYALNVSIFNIKQPSFGLSFTVGIEMGWTLTKVDTGAVVWRESITTEHTATVGDAFSGVERLRMANEGAARANVAQGLAKISALSL